MRILIISELFPFCDAEGEFHVQGGGENHMYSISRELSRKNTVSVLTSLIPKSAYPEKWFPFQIFTVDNKKTTGRRPADFRFSIRLSREITRLQQSIDVVVPQTFVPIYSTILAQIKKPVVPIIHDVYQPIPVISGILAWRDLQNNNLLRGIQGSLLERLCLYYASKCSAVITVSNSSCEILQYWIPRQKLRITGNGIYKEEFRSTAKDIDIICIARFDAPYKNVDQVCEAVCNSDLKTVIVGSGKLKQKIEMKYSCKNIEFVGSVSQSKKRELLSRSKILVSASSLEGFGLTLLEGLASGCLVVASDIKPHRFVDQNSNSIKFFQVGDITGFKAILNQLLNLSENEVAEVRAKGYALIDRTWNWPGIADKTELVLNSVI